MHVWNDMGAINDRTIIFWKNYAFNSAIINVTGNQCCYITKTLSVK